jgi:hypothetical protein
VAADYVLATANADGGLAHAQSSAGADFAYDIAESAAWAEKSIAEANLDKNFRVKEATTRSTALSALAGFERAIRESDF